MALQTLNTIKDWFKTGLKPSQTQFWDTWDSFRHKDEKVPVAEVEGMDEIIDSKADKMILDNHLTDDAAHADLFNDKEDKNQKGAPDGYAPLDEFTKLAAQYLNIVNDLVTGGAESLLSAEQGKVLQMQVNAINNLLTSDNMNLDTLQELVDAVETVQASLSTILVNDLTTGGMTKALTAEMGKTLKGLIDTKAAITHSHQISDVNGLQSAINSKISKSDSAFHSVSVDDYNFNIQVSSHSSNLVIESFIQTPVIAGIDFAPGFEPYDGKVFSITNNTNSVLFPEAQFVSDNVDAWVIGETYLYILRYNSGSYRFISTDNLKSKRNKVLTVHTTNNINQQLLAVDDHLVFTSPNPVTFIIPTNASVPIPIGKEVQYTQQGDGIVTVGGAGITFVTNLALAMVKGETRKLTKIATDTWSLEGNIIDDSQVEVSSNTNVLEFWNKKTILFTANCTIIVPATLLSQYGFVFRTLAGVTVTWAITAPFTWETTPSTTPEKTTGSFMRRGNTNTILLDF
nr:hypothetical protein [uncultured Flavobacterium sp.]